MRRAAEQRLEGGPRLLLSEVSLRSSRRIDGYVYDPEDLDRHFVVELVLDGQPAALTRAQLHDSRLQKKGVGDGCYRFSFAVDPDSLGSGHSAEVRLANTGDLLGRPISMVVEQDAAPADASSVSWSGGLRLFGWLNEESDAPLQEVRAFIDGVCVARTKAVHWMHVGHGRDAVAARGFELHLPPAFADGRVRRASIIDAAGRPLRGSPCQFIAFRDGLCEFLGARAEIESEKIRGRLFDQVFPQSLPFAAFAEWSIAYPLAAPAASEKSKYAVAIIGGTAAAAATLASLEVQPGINWVAAVFGGEDSQTSFDNRSLSTFLTGAAKGCDIVVFSLSGTVFRQNALSRLGECFVSFPRAGLAYCDVTIATDDGTDWPIAFPSFDYERMLEQGYCAYVFAMPIAGARKAAGAGASNLYRLANAALDHRRSADPVRGDNEAGAAPVHVPGFLARIPRLDLADGSLQLAVATDLHLRARGVAAAVEPSSGGIFPCARVRREMPAGKVSLLIPTRDRADLLRPCLQSLVKTIGMKNNELIVINNDSSDPDALACIGTAADQGARVVNVKGPFSFARLIGAAASVATRDFLLIMSNDVEAISEDWLEEMLRRAAEPEVGAVGATLLWPDGVVRHAGIVLGMGLAAGFASDDRVDGDPGYSDRLIVAHECSAVSGACLLTRRSLFRALDGFDASRFPTDYGDVDYCLRLRAAGYRVVMAPQARLFRQTSARHERVPGIGDVNRVPFELRNMRAAWAEVLLDDPYYNPMLSTHGNPFSALACPPRSYAPRQLRGVRPRPVPLGL